MESNARKDQNVELVFDDAEMKSVNVTSGMNLSEVLDINNSPILFGCRTGICGTCLIEVETSPDIDLEPPNDFERESLEIFAPGNPKARLACQIHAQVPMRIRKIQAK